MAAMNIFGRPLVAGPVRFDDGRFHVEAEIETIDGGYLLRGTLRGRGGRIEICRMPAPRRFLLNNWQSWGPTQAVSPEFRFPGLAERMAAYSRWVFTPIPEVFASTLVSDYFAAWEDGLAGFLSSRIAHPVFRHRRRRPGRVCRSISMCHSTSPSPLEPLIVLEGGPPVDRSSRTTPIRTAAENGVVVRARNPVGWSSWYQYFTDLTAADLEKNLRLSAEGGFPFEVFQIDDGYERDIGDWLQVKEGFTPLPDLARMIRERGFTAGLWTAPFSAVRIVRVFRRHPEWFVRGGRPAQALLSATGKKRFTPSTPPIPAALEWLFETFTALRRMGYSYFKIDFLFAAAMAGERQP